MRNGASSGFSLIEFTNGLPALALLLSAGIGGAADYVADLQRTTVSNQLLVGLRLARSAAHEFSTVVTVCPSRDGRVCSPRGDWSDGWIAFVDGNANGEIDAVERAAIVARALNESGGRVAVVSEWDRLSFAPGRPVAVNDNDASATLCIRDSRGVEYSRVVWIDARGRAQIRESRPPREESENMARDFSQRSRDCYRT